jgi:hypothetical protein
MKKIEYWSLGCDILGGPKDRAVKIATAQMPEIARDIAESMNATSETSDARALLQRIARKGEFMDLEGLRITVSDWLARRHILPENVNVEARDP